jgi:glutaminyl-peptide cyclotransferase
MKNKQFMKKIVAVLGLALALSSCSKSSEVKDALHSLSLNMSSENYYLGDAIALPEAITANAEKIIFNDGEREFESKTFDPKFFSLGENTLSIEVQLKGGDKVQEDINVVLYAKTPEKELAFEVVAEYPHNPKDFCQGFEYINGAVYEGTGQEGESKVQKYSLGQSAPSQSVNNTADVFGEGITVLKDKIYQLTWKNGKMFSYDMGMKALGEQAYPANIKEGWGLSNNGQQLLMSDGSHRIYFIDPAKPQQVQRQIAVAGHDQIFNQINELEFHKGALYANVWHQNHILKINANTGEVLAKINLESLAKPQMKDPEDVLNGIAFKGENMLVTGKNWSKIYEIKLK